ncbi:hypothetical protein DPEC_G00345210 [Dallia pectoralis]|uniref:Uncharacterized protein n=1 Tax=Dallia pectoralis TaxID=75939 RepID=A0ACC2F3L3_DALPE|nr:hypothetical protein DPEC_G00345210 [Dallia pectoralis]
MPKVSNRGQQHVAQGRLARCRDVCNALLEERDRRDIRGEPESSSALPQRSHVVLETAGVYEDELAALLGFSGRRTEPAVPPALSVCVPRRFPSNARQTVPQAVKGCEKEPGGTAENHFHSPLTPASSPSIRPASSASLSRARQTRD